MNGKIKSGVRLILAVGLVAFSLNNLLSCSGNKLTTQEAQVVENYTKAKNHDPAIIGEWTDNSTLAIKDNISFDEQGISFFGRRKNPVPG